MANESAPVASAPSAPAVAPAAPAAPIAAPVAAAAPAVTPDTAAVSAGSPGSGPESISGAEPSATPPTTAEPAAEAAASSEATSILSEAKSGDAEGEIPPVDAKETTDKPVEAKAEEAKPAEPAPKPVYDALKLPEGMTADEAQVKAYDDIIGNFEQRVAADPTTAHAAFGELRQQLAEMHAAAVKQAIDRHDQLRTEGWNELQAKWAKEFRDDPQIGKARQTTSLQQMGRLIEQYGVERGKQHEAALRQKMALTGMGNSIEMLRFAVWAAGKRTETARLITPSMPKAAQSKGTPAQRLYRNSIPAQGAA